jgi:hypothetical protein
LKKERLKKGSSSNSLKKPGINSDFHLKLHPHTYSIRAKYPNEDAIANDKSGYYQEQIGKFKDFFTVPPVQEGYEVVVQA